MVLLRNDNEQTRSSKGRYILHLETRVKSRIKSPHSITNYIT